MPLFQTTSYDLGKHDMNVRTTLEQHLENVFLPAEPGLGRSFSSSVTGDGNGGKSVVEVGVLNQLTHLFHPVVFYFNGWGLQGKTNRKSLTKIAHS